jgi:hypothetical protein
VRKITLAVFCALLALPALSTQAKAAARPGAGSIVIVFKDGHRQMFNLADIDRIEFPGGSAVASGAAGDVPPRGRFFGKWEAGDGAGNSFTITLNENGSARRSIGDVHGHWSYVNGEALITWDDGRKDAIRRVGNRYQKSAYDQNKSFTDQPDNITDAHNTAQKPI